MKTKLWMPILASILTLTLLSGTKIAMALPTLYVDPPMTADTMLGPGNIFTININIADVANLYGVDFKLSFDPSVIMATSIVPGDFWVGGVFEWVNYIDPSGYAMYTVTRPLGTIGGLSGSGTVAVIEFNVNALGSSYLILYDVDLADQYANPIPYNLQHGYFSNIATTFNANIIGRSAWPESHHYVVAKDAPPLGDGNITFNAKLSNIGTVTTLAKVVFDIFNELGNPVTTVESLPVILKADETVVVTYNWDGYIAGKKYHVMAQAWYDSNGDYTIDALGIKQKSFSFAVVP